MMPVAGVAVEAGPKALSTSSHTRGSSRSHVTWLQGCVLHACRVDRSALGLRSRRVFGVQHLPVLAHQSRSQARQGAFESLLQHLVLLGDLYPFWLCNGWDCVKLTRLIPYLETMLSDLPAPFDEAGLPSLLYSTARPHHWLLVL